MGEGGEVRAARPSRVRGHILTHLARNLTHLARNPLPALGSLGQKGEGKRVYCHASEEIVALAVPLASVMMRKVVSS